MIEESPFDKCWEWLEDEDWKFFCNIFENDGIGWVWNDELEPPMTISEQINQLTNKYGLDNVKVMDEAYDYQRKLIPSGKGIFLRRSVYPK